MKGAVKRRRVISCIPPLRRFYKRRGGRVVSAPDFRSVWRKSLDLSKTIFDISLSSSALTKSVVKIKCCFFYVSE